MNCRLQRNLFLLGGTFYGRTFTAKFFNISFYLRNFILYKYYYTSQHKSKLKINSVRRAKYLMKDIQSKKKNKLDSPCSWKTPTYNTTNIKHDIRLSPSWNLCFCRFKIRIIYLLITITSNHLPEEKLQIYFPIKAVVSISQIDFTCNMLFNM